MSNGVCEIVREACGHDQALLSFSCGKDSWAAWLSARDHFDFQPYYLYLVPGLEFVEEYLVYAEKVLGKRIVRLPHPSFYRMLNHAIFQAPERLRIILAADLGEPDYEDMRDAVIEDCELPDNCWVASGVRAADSPMRRAALMKNGGVNANRRQFYPCWDWNKATLLEQLVKAGIKLPIDYKVFGRSFDGLDLRFLIKIREHFPRDYATICEWFPLVDMEFARYEFCQRKRANQQLFEKADFDLGDLLGGSKAKSLDALAKGTKAETADPIGAIDYENLSNEQAAGQEISATLAAFKQRALTEQARFEAATDSEFWLGVCFQTRAQKEAFLLGVNMLQHGDKYIDGELLARRMGIALPEADVPYNVSAKPDKKLAAMVLEKS